MPQRVVLLITPVDPSGDLSKDIDTIRQRAERLLKKLNEDGQKFALHMVHEDAPESADNQANASKPSFMDQVRDGLDPETLAELDQLREDSRAVLAEAGAAIDEAAAAAKAKIASVSTSASRFFAKIGEKLDDPDAGKHAGDTDKR